MRKLFLLLPALVLALALNAAVININTETADALRLALNSAADGDIIEMAAGTYVESNENYIAFTGKAVTVRAAEGAEVILQPKVPITISEGGCAHFENVKIDASRLTELADWYEHVIYPIDAAVGNRIILEGCEIYGFALNNSLIGCSGSNALDALTINNCYFHNINKSCVFIENTTNAINISITNSTFANITTDAGSYYAGVIDSRATSGSFLVDHCTFYNVQVINTDYAAIGNNKNTPSGSVVSNCIFAMPSSVDGVRAIRNIEQANNCLTFNYVKDGGGIYSSVTQNNCKKNKDPLFKDAANGDFSLYASSPARGASDDNSDLGDPRWYKALAPIAIPATLVPFDALLSEKASIIQSTPDSIFLKTVSETIKEWAKWKISVAEDGLYEFTAYAKRTDSDGSQRLQIDVLNSTETETLKSNAKTDLPNECTISTGAVNLVAGNTYVIKVYNNYEYAKTKLIKVEASYAGGKIIAIPDTLRPVDAIRSERAFVNEAGELRFTDDDHTGYIHDQWGKWNISVAEAGKYKFEANVNSSNGQNYRITLKNADESATIDTWYGEDDDSGERKIATELVDLTAGNYVLMIEDTVKWSKGRVVNIVASYEGGKTVNVPGQILGEDALLKKESTGTKTMIRQENGDIKSSNNANPTTEYAEWNINATAGKFEVTLNLDPVTSNGHNYRIELYNGNTLVDYSEELVSAEPADAVHSKGDVKLAKTLTISSAGAYTLKLVNRTQWSSMILHGITFTSYVAPEPPAVVIMTDTDTDNAAWIAEKNNTVDVQLNRTILGGMYNTICLPFKVSTTQCKTVFGDDVELWTLGSAELSGDILNLNFNPANDIWKGTPIMIKTSHDVVNPNFTGVTIESETGDVTPKNAANFRGTFISTEFHAGDPVLLLMANNTLVFPQSDKTLKGFRAYFQINGNPANAPKRARIILQEQVATDIDLIQPQMVNAAKVIENGQLVIIKNGVRYNVMGAMIK